VSDREQVEARIVLDDERRHRLENFGPYRRWQPGDGPLWVCDRCGAAVGDVLAHENWAHPE